MRTKDLEITSLRMQLTQLTSDYKLKVKVRRECRQLKAAA